VSRRSRKVLGRWVVESCKSAVLSRHGDESGATQGLGRRRLKSDDSWWFQPINRGVRLTFWHRFLKRRSAAILKTRLQHFFIFFSPFQSSSNIHPRSKIEIEDPRAKAEDLHPFELDFID
jgi:hypothetical protein